MPGRRRDPERFLTTVVMTDIVGSTEHAAELGDSGWRELVQLHHRIVRAALRRHSGRELDTAGDGFFAVFDAPAGAVACALEIVDQVRQLGLEVRIGVHVGEVEQIARKVGGISVVIASRIMAAAEPSEVLVSSTVRDLAAGSKLAFEDRGVRQLKGVPGEWRVFAVVRADANAVDAGATTTGSERRAAAVQRAQARPIWQRRPRLVAAAVVGLALIIATGGLLVWKPWQSPALASVTENSIGIIDPDRGEVIGQIPVGTRPGGIAVGEGYAWVTNTGSDTVSKIDLNSRSVVDSIDVGHAPTGIVVAQGSVWVANSGDRTVSRINAATGTVVQSRIEVGNRPTAIVAVGDLLWVANATDSTVRWINSRTGEAGPIIGVSATPIALAGDENGLWVASEDGASVGQLDPVTGVARSAPVQLNARPAALALDQDYVWVVSGDGTVFRIERATNRLKQIDVGGSLAAIVISDNSIWVGDHGGNVYRLDAADTSAIPRHVSTGSAVVSLAAVDGNVWLAAQASATSHRGGTLSIVGWEGEQFLPRFRTDPLTFPAWNVSSLVADGLVGYRRVGGGGGAVLLPDLATSVPQPTNGGLTYTFQLRPNLVYSTGEPVRAADFRSGIERSFQVLDPIVPDWTGWGIVLFSGIKGAEACAPTGTLPLVPVERCDLEASQGIVTNDQAGTVTFNLSQPDPDFVYKLVYPAYPVPVGVPMNELVDEAFPGTGPYVVSSVTVNGVRLARNPLFHVWDAEVRPDGFADEIVFTVVEDKEQSSSLVMNGQADYTTCVQPGICTEPEVYEQISTQYVGQLHRSPGDTRFVAMNSSIPPFNNLYARQAVNFAIDRAHIAELRGLPAATITCQLLPPGYPGYQPYCPYTLDPDPGNLWHGPDMDTAQRLVDESGTRGAPVVVGPANGGAANVLLFYVRSVLQQLGYNVAVDARDANGFPGLWNMDRTQITVTGWGADYLAPSTFLGLFKCGGWLDFINYCDPEFDAAYEHALGLQATDRAAAAIEWAALDHRGVDLALLAPMSNSGISFVSARVGNYQFSPAWGALFDQMWVQ